MRILHFLWALDNGGAENMAVDLVNEQSHDNDVTLLIANAHIENLVRARISPAVRFVCLGRPKGSQNPFWMVWLLFTLHRLAPDVVHSHSEKLAKLGRFISAKLVLTVHDTHMKLDASASRFSLVCCISSTVLRDVRARYPMLNLRQVNNGIMISEITTGRRRRGTSIRGIQVSRLVHEKKGQDLLIRALATINSQAEQQKLTIDFVGDGPSLAYLVAVAEDAGVADFCHFVGALSRQEIYNNLCEYDILIQPSRFEGFGLTVAEGMAAGVAVVVSDIEGPMEIICNGELGLSFKSGDIDALAAALHKAISYVGTPDGDAVQEAARKHVTEKYDVRQTSANYCRIYREVIDA